ncbi:hypothetical protein ACJRO7_000539 [Eucalyptus globulus]|uniref:Retrotransposon gag domain-containing protein n=1 Tax=Eucalyptus globulus TaxID=34317 RepID=A0ABD3LMX4_EUCGL
MAEENVPSPIEIMENEMKQVFNVLQQLSKQIDSIQGKLAPAPASIEVLLPQSSIRGDQGRDTDDNMPELEDDTHQIIVEKVKPNCLSKTKHDKCLEKLEEKLKQLQGLQDPTSTDLSIYSKVKIPEKFKMPEFEKYNGMTCPMAHLQMYLVRMTQYVNNVPLMIQLFQSSLVGPALRWYITKNINLLETWSEASEAFLKQYKFIMDITPSREDLECTEKKKHESFKEYAIRWRNLATQISPEPTNFELRKMFIKTLPYEYCNRMVTTIAESFNQLILVGEQIEIGLRDGWFTEPDPSAEGSA